MIDLKFLFGDIVVINKNQIGVVVKTWKSSSSYEYEIYNRITSNIESYVEKDVERYRVRHKYLNEEEMEYQWTE
jgi:hypothetical protein